MRIAIIGSSGHWSNFFHGARGADRDPVVAVAPGGPDERVDTVVQACRDNSHPAREYPDWRRLLEDARPELVIVNPRFDRTARILVAALDAGAHCYVEKPLAVSEEDLEAVIAAIARAPGQVVPMFSTRYRPAFFGAWQQVRAGAIGTVRMIAAQKSYKLGDRPEFFRDRRRFGGLIPWVGSHMVDLIRWFTGGAGVRSVRAVHERSDNGGMGDLEVAAQCQFVLERGIMASLSVDYLRPAGAPSHGDDRIRVVGNRGIIEVQADSVTLLTEEGRNETELAVAPPHELFADVLAAYQGAIPLVDADDGVEATRICLAARRSADENREVIL